MSTKPRDRANTDKLDEHQLQEAANNQQELVEESAQQDLSFQDDSLYRNPDYFI